MMKRIRFKKGYIDVFDQRVLLIPQDILTPISLYLVEHPEVAPELYEQIRQSFMNHFANGMKKFYKLKGRDNFNWLIDLSDLGGWGQSKLIKFDLKNKSGVFRITDAPIGAFFKGQANLPVDHLWRGIAAGGLSRIFDQTIDWIEVKCLGSGDNYCEFIFKPHESFTEEEKKKFKYQVNFD